MKKKILIVGFPNSIHTLNWISSIDLSKFKVFFFPSTSNKLSCINDNRVTYYKDHFRVSKIKMSFYCLLSLFSIDKLLFTPKVFLKQITHNKYVLKEYIFFLQPDIIHSLEIQHSGYLTYDAINKSKVFNNKLILSNYGSDIYFFEKFNFHKKKIIEILDFFNEVVCESKRDIILCKKYNNQIKTHLILNSGGINFRLGNLSSLKSRKNIIIKGYHGNFGKFLLIASYLRKFKSEINYKNIYVYSSSFFSRVYANFFYKNLKIVFLPQMTKKKLFNYFKKSFIYIGASISDGVSTSALDAISTKTFPLQTNTSTLNEMLREKSILFDLHDFNDFKNKFLFITNNKNLAQNIINRIYIKSKKYDNKIVKSKILRLYS